MPEIQDIRIDSVKEPTETSLRLAADPTALTSLVASIAAHGLLQPIVVQATSSGFRLLAGTRRLAACVRLSKQLIRASVYRADETIPAGAAIAENLCRLDMTPLEEAAAVRDLLTHQGETTDSVAAMFGRSADWLASRLELLDQPIPLQQAVHIGRIGVGVARELAQIDDEPHRDFLLNAAIEHGCTVRQAVAWRLNYQAQRPATEAPQDVAPHRPDSRPPPVLLEPCFSCHDHTAVQDLTRYPLCNRCALLIDDAARSSAGAGVPPPRIPPST